MRPTLPSSARCLALASAVLATGCEYSPSEAPESPVAPAASAPEVPEGADLPTGEPEAPGLEVHRAAVRPPPITGGTLAVTADARYALFADADRAAVHRLDLASGTLSSVQLLPGDEPGRVVFDPSQETAFVVLRGRAQVLVMDVASFTVRFRVETCQEPRGLAVDAAGTGVVACESGRIVRFDAATGERLEASVGAPDLRDVIAVAPGEFRFTTFRQPRVGELSLVNAEFVETYGMTPAVAWRTIALPHGGTATIHQFQRSAQLPKGAPYYGTSGGCFGGVVTGGLTVVAPNGWVEAWAKLADAPLPVDVAASPDGRWLVYVAAGANVWNGGHALGADQVGVLTRSELTNADSTGCAPKSSWAPGEAFEPIAVAATATDLWVQSREPAALIRVPVELPEGAGSLPVLGAPEVHRFALYSVADTGHQLFHRAPTGSGAACASCHPEGEDDGHVWDFEEFGLRRTPPINGGIFDTAPYHWAGDLKDFDALVEDVMVGRMAAPRISVDARSALAEFVDSVRLRVMTDAELPEAVAAGRNVFFTESVGCAKCHVGGQGSDNEGHDVGTGGVFQTPLLRGLRVRAPYMHDGCAATLADRFTECGGDDRHGKTADLTDSQRSNLLAYLNTL